VALSAVFAQIVAYLGSHRIESGPFFFPGVARQANLIVNITLVERLVAKRRGLLTGGAPVRPQHRLVKGINQHDAGQGRQN
jgi:hypothetical protein